VCVFGCGGERDAGKRPQMGAIAAALADRIVVTSDNPRSEDPSVIANAVVKGIRDAGHRRWAIENDRLVAIRDAVSAARPGDVVLIAGKGHEQGQIIGAGETTRVLPFDDVTVARECAAELAGADQ